MKDLDSLIFGRYYNLFYSSEILQNLKRPKDSALVAQYLGRSDVCNEAVQHTFGIGNNRILVYDVEYYRPGSEDISVNKLESGVPNSQDILPLPLRA